MDSRDLFISHASEDDAVARELRAALEAAGYTCWMAPDDVVGSRPWAEQILTAIDSTRIMVVLISKSANESVHVSREVNLALGHARAILPVRIEAVAPGGALEYLLTLVQRADAFPLPVEGHMPRIRRMVDALLETAPPTTPAPATPSTPTPDPDAVADAPGKPVGIGTVLAGFTLEALVAEGGMATVYRALQAEPRREVAVKVVREDRAADPGYRNRFLAEKDTLARLEHPSIVPIYAAGEAHGVLYIAMRLLDGPDLATRLAKDGPLTLGQTVDLLRPIADAVDYAHEMGVVHRDLKPANIVLDRGGRPYLTDFGLGKQITGGTDLSQAGITVGTLEYLAPELLTGRGDPSLAARTDLYALGCVAFACLSGRPPYAIQSPEQLLFAQTQPVPRLRPLRPDLPAGVDDVMARAIARDPRERFATARELVDALAGAVVAAVPDGTRPIPLPVSQPQRPPGPGPAPEPGPAGAAGGAGAGAWIRGHVALAAGGIGVAVLAIVAAAIVLGGPKPSPSPSPSAAVVTPAPSTTPTPKPLPPPIPTGLTAHAVIPTEVDLTWSAPAPGAVVTGYQVLRDGDLVHALGADAVAYRDLGTAPNTTYSYSVVAVGPGGPSDGAKAAATTGAMPPATEARFDGQWTVSSKATAANAGDVKTGATRVDTWTVTPSCTAGSCDVTVANVLQRTVTASLARSDTGYAGTLAETWTDPKCGPVHETIDITVAPTAAGFDLAGEPLVERIEGTADVTVKPDGGTCDPATVTWSLTGIAAPPDLGSLLDPKLQCASPAAKPDLVHWKDAVATAGCTGTAGPITFYQYLTASAAEAAFRAFVGINTSGAAGCIAATPAAGYGPWARPGAAENAGDVACGPPQGGAAGAWVYTWTDWDHAIVGYAQWTDSKALRDLWASPESWLAP